MRLLALIPALLIALAAQATGEAESIQKELARTLPEVRADQIRPSPIPGLFELRLGPQVAYVSADGKYLLRGDIIDLSSNVNVTEQRRSGARLAAINEVGDGRMIVFSPRQVKHTITVFTDIDCGYCRKLHREMDQYLDRGIRVRYLFFPRSGPKTESWTKAEQVWCAKNRNDAITRSKRGEVLSGPACNPNPVQQHYSLGIELGVQGTPAIITDSGELVPGYVPVEELAGILENARPG
ncbi:MAG: DsbC family protein [Gammaproteobacteria bacterium]|nr:DsbC family protein [Gammaproteobacteria bacterium]